MIFVDTGFLFALASNKDEHHERALAVFRRYKGVRLPDLLLTTNHVVSETITLSRVLGHDKAVDMGERLYSEKLARIHWATRDEEKDAFAYFTKYRDQDYSAVDCLSFVIMKKYGIDTAWSVDDDFTHSFRAEPGPKPKR